MPCCTVSGDHKGLNSFWGLGTGASSNHCLWCETKRSSDWCGPWGEGALRTSQSLQVGT